ncbi:MAG: hypothetical protein V4519_03655 [Patescibacteria group bacterium]
MKTLQKLSVIMAVVVMVSVFVVNFASAITPSLSVHTINNDWVRVTVQADSYAPVYLYYMPSGSGSWTSTNSIGTTDANGYFSTTLSSNGYNIPAGTNVYAMVNNQQSSYVNWPYYTNNYNNSTALNLSRNNVQLSQGQTVTVTSTRGSLYISSNTNTNIVNAYANGSVVTLSAPNYSQQGSATVTVCSSNNNTPCATIYVDVQSSHPYNNSWVNVSQTNISLNTGQSQTVTLHGSGSYYLSNSSNSYVASASLNGNELNIRAQNPGNAVITVCSSVYNSNNSNPCVSVNVSVQTASVVTPIYVPVQQEPTTVYLNQVPYTGSSTTNIALFMTALAAWTGGLAYFLVRRKALKA